MNSTPEMERAAKRIEDFATNFERDARRCRHGQIDLGTQRYADGIRRAAKIVRDLGDEPTDAQVMEAFGDAG